MEAAQDWIANLAILRTDFQRQTWYATFWSRFAGFTQITQDERGQPIKRPAGQPIEVMTDFVQKGRDNMLVPFDMELTGSPVFGDTKAKGTGEVQELNWTRCYINQYRKVVKPSVGKMADQRAKMYRMASRAEPKLRRWFKRYWNVQVPRTFYEGISENISAPQSVDGLGVKKRYHPNWYYHVTSDGNLDPVGTEKYSKTVAQLDTAAGAVAYGFTTNLLETLAPLCEELRIPQVEVGPDGEPFWVILVHPQQLKTLRGETAWLNAQREAWSGARNSPILNGAAGFYNGFAIFKDIWTVRGWDTTNDNLFPEAHEDQFKPTSVTGNYNAIVFGNQAIAKGQGNTDGGQYLDMEMEEDDFGNIQEVAGIAMDGFSRNDYVDEDNASEASGGVFEKGTEGGVIAATELINQSSLIVMTT